MHVACVISYFHKHVLKLVNSFGMKAFKEQSQLHVRGVRQESEFSFLKNVSLAINVFFLLDYISGELWGTPHPENDLLLSNSKTDI